MPSFFLISKESGLYTKIVNTTITESLIKLNGSKNSNNIFGSLQEVNEELALALKPVFLEVLIAPSYTEGAKKVLARLCFAPVETTICDGL